MSQPTIEDMDQSALQQWQMANQQYLMDCIREVQEKLEAHRPASDTEDRFPHVEDTAAPRHGQDAATGIAAYALDTLVHLFHLSSFERSILLLCAGIELDARIGQLVAVLQGSPFRMLPSFGLALAAFSDAHWSALSPNAPLRYWKLIEPVESSTHQLLTTMPLRIDENILFYLTGVHYLDERLGELVYPGPSDTWLVPSQQAKAEEISQGFVGTPHRFPPPVMQLQGDGGADKIAIASYTCEQNGLHLYTLSTLAISHSTTAITEWTRLWNRHAVIHGWALYLEYYDTESGDLSRTAELSHFIENIQGWIFISADEWSPVLKRSKITITINKPGYDEQIMLWQSSLGLEQAAAKDLVSQFHLSVDTIRSVSNEIIEKKLPASDTAAEKEQSVEVAKRVWKACCVATRPQMDDLVRRIEPVATWEDIVLPPDQLDILKELAMQVKQRSKVYGEWGFGAVSSRGLGISALFTGDSGTGKTMASEVLANELQLDLYRVDLSQVVNKYIGETEKNLKRIFDAAENGGSILLFDEADALFGKRSEVKDSHDRYGNIEVSYLLQRMEAYRGLAILTTNLKSTLDQAFHRRIRFIVQFPFPAAQMRAAIWRKVFPPATPTRDLDPGKLSRLNIPGGNIRNIALNAAFIAAHEGRAVQMSHISRAVRGEYNKLEKPLNTLETGGLV